MGNLTVKQRDPDPNSTWGQRAVARRAIESSAARPCIYRTPQTQAGELAARVETALECGAVESLEFADGLVQVIVLTDARGSIIQVYQPQDKDAVVAAGPVHSMLAILRGTVVRTKAVTELHRQAQGKRALAFCFRYSSLDRTLPDIRQWLQSHPDHLQGGKLLERVLTPVFDAMHSAGPSLVPSTVAGSSSDVVTSSPGELEELGSEVVLPDAGGIAGGRVASTEVITPNCGPQYLIVRTKVIVSDGQTFFLKLMMLPIFQYAGRIAIKDLPVRPMDKTMRNLLRNRGRRFAALAIGSHFRQYQGQVLVRDSLGGDA